MPRTTSATRAPALARRALTEEPRDAAAPRPLDDSAGPTPLLEAHAAREIAASSAAELAREAGERTRADREATAAAPAGLGGSGLLGGILAARGAKAASPFAPSSALDDPKSNVAFRHWATDQLAGRAEVREVFDAIGARLTSQPSGTLAELFNFARGAARAAFDDLGGLGALGDKAEHHVTAVALTALAAHSLRVPGSDHASLPIYLHDGRALDQGSDKAGHVINQALFTFVVRFDRAFADGKLAERFLGAAARFDAGGAGARIGQAYEQTSGRAGPLLPTSAPPAVEPLIPYFASPSDLSNEERRIYEAAVRLADAHEHTSTYSGYHPAALGTTRVDVAAPGVGPLSGLTDPGVSRDLTANRVGAWLGLALFRAPGSIPEIPFDDGEGWTSRPFARDPHTDVAALRAARPTDDALAAVLRKHGASLFAATNGSHDHRATRQDLRNAAWSDAFPFPVRCAAQALLDEPERWRAHRALLGEPSPSRGCAGERWDAARRGNLVEQQLRVRIGDEGVVVSATHLPDVRALYATNLTTGARYGADVDRGEVRLAVDARAGHDLAFEILRAGAYTTEPIGSRSVHALGAGLSLRLGRQPETAALYGKLPERVTALYARNMTTGVKHGADVEGGAAYLPLHGVAPGDPLELTALVDGKRQTLGTVRVAG